MQLLEATEVAIFEFENVKNKWNLFSVDFNSKNESLKIFKWMAIIPQINVVLIPLLFP